MKILQLLFKKEEKKEEYVFNEKEFTVLFRSFLDQKKKEYNGFFVKVEDRDLHRMKERIKKWITRFNQLEEEKVVDTTWLHKQMKEVVKLEDDSFVLRQGLIQLKLLAIEPKYEISIQDGTKQLLIAEGRLVILDFVMRRKLEISQAFMRKFFSQKRRSAYTKEEAKELFEQNIESLMTENDLRYFVFGHKLAWLSKSKEPWMIQTERAIKDMNVRFDQLDKAFEKVEQERKATLQMQKLEEVKQTDNQEEYFRTLCSQ